MLNLFKWPRYPRQEPKPEPSIGDLIAAVLAEDRKKQPHLKTPNMIRAFIESTNLNVDYDNLVDGEYCPWWDEMQHHPGWNPRRIWEKTAPDRRKRKKLNQWDAIAKGEHVYVDGMVSSMCFDDQAKNILLHLVNRSEQTPSHLRLNEILVEADKKVTEELLRRSHSKVDGDGLRRAHSILEALLLNLDSTEPPELP